MRDAPLLTTTGASSPCNLADQLVQEECPRRVALTDRRLSIAYKPNICRPVPFHLPIPLPAWSLDLRPHDARADANARSASDTVLVRRHRNVIRIGL